MALVTPAATRADVSRAPSVYLERPVDPQALELARPSFAVHADGRGDDAPALQAAIDQVHALSGGRGVLFVPSGTYRLGSTVNVWRGVRLIGYGPQRPVFLLGAATPGFAGPEPRSMFFFAWDRPRAGEAVREGGASGFFAALINVDLDLETGNPAAVGVNFHVAQHSFLAHVDFRIGDARAGVEEVGNLMHHCRFFGGEHGIIARRTAPTWPFVLLDSEFAGQRVSAIRTEEAGLTLLRVQIRDVPRAIEVNPDRSEQLWLRDSRLSRIGKTAITLADSHHPLTQANLENVQCEQVPQLLGYHDREDIVLGPAERYVVDDLVQGLQISAAGAAREVKLTSRIRDVERLPDLPSSELTPLPPASTWKNARALGAKGDGVTDDTAALQRAVEDHDVVFLPAGRYLLHDTLELRAGNVLIGLNPASTVLIAAPTAAAFTGEGVSVPMLRTARGGRVVVSGLGLDTGIAPRVGGVEWRAGAASLVEDVCFVSSHSARGERPEAEARSAWDTQGHSLWVRDGGGGTFANIWTANTTARSGLRISDTTTPGRVYAMSAEHHVYREVMLERTRNWEFFALQTEAEGDEGVEALQVEINDCGDLLFANLFMYRVSRTRRPYPEAVRLQSCGPVHFRGVRVYSPTKFSYDRLAVDATTGRSEFARAVASVTFNSDTPASPATTLTANVVRLAHGFEGIDGLTMTADGSAVFIDGRQGRIYRWSDEEGLEAIGDAPVRPAALIVDPVTGAIATVARSGRAFVATSRTDWRPLERVPRSDVPSQTMWLLPTTRFGPYHDFLMRMIEPSPEALVVGQAAVPSATPPAAVARPHPWVLDPLWRGYSVKAARQGESFYVADEGQAKTYRFRVGNAGELTQPELFANVGETDVARAPDGRVIVAAGLLHVFSADGALLGLVELPERPTAVVWHPSAADSVYVAARTALFLVRLPQHTR